MHKFTKNEADVATEDKAAVDSVVQASPDWSRLGLHPAQREVDPGLQVGVVAVEELGPVPVGGVGRGHGPLGLHREGPPLRAGLAQRRHLGAGASVGTKRWMEG